MKHAIAAMRALARCVRDGRRPDRLADAGGCRYQLNWRSTDESSQDVRGVIDKLIKLIKLPLPP
jgi:hypothetical protein